MIDGTNIMVIPAGSADHFVQNTLFNWDSRYNPQTGEEIRFPITCRPMDGLKLTVKSKNKIELTGSLHKAFYHGTNATDFTFNNLFELIYQLSELLAVNPFECKIQSLEFGVNLCTPFPVHDFLSRLICYKGARFNKMRDIRTGWYCDFSRYEIKIYDKGIQENILSPLLRFEVKARRSIELKETGIVYLSDLLNPGKLSLLGAKLLFHFDKILLNDHSIDLRVEIPLKLTTSFRNILTT